MNPIAELVGKFRPDVAAAGVDPVQWWYGPGWQEFKGALGNLGRTDVLQQRGGSPEDLAAWYVDYGQREHPNIWAARGTQIPGVGVGVKEPDLAQQYAGAAGEAPTAPTLRELLPYETAWGQFEPFAREQAEYEVAPEAARQYQQAARGYVGDMAGAGGGRFGRAWGGLGALGAEHERQRKYDVQSMYGTLKAGFDPVYGALEESWTKGMTQAKPPSEGWGAYAQSKLPSWEDLQKQYSSQGLI